MNKYTCGKMPNKWILRSNINQQGSAMHNNGDEINQYNVKWKKKTLKKSEPLGEEPPRMLLRFISKLVWSFYECSLNNYSSPCTFEWICLHVCYSSHVFFNVYKHFGVNSISTLHVFMKAHTYNNILKYQDFITNIIVSENLHSQLFVIIFSDFFEQYTVSSQLKRQWTSNKIQAKVL